MRSALVLAKPGITAVEAVLSIVAVTPAAGAITHQRSAVITAAVGDKVASAVTPLAVFKRCAKLVVISPPIKRLVALPSNPVGTNTVWGLTPLRLPVSAGINSSPVRLV